MIELKKFYDKNDKKHFGESLIFSDLPGEDMSVRLEQNIDFSLIFFTVDFHFVKEILCNNSFNAIEQYRLKIAIYTRL